MVVDVDRTRKGRMVLLVADEDVKGSVVKVVCQDEDVDGVKKGDIVEITGLGLGRVTVFGRVSKGGK